MRFALLSGVLGAIGGFILAGCPSSSVPPETAPVVYGDAGPFVLSTSDGPADACALACAALQEAGCITLDDCPTVMGAVETNRIRRLPDGTPWTCAKQAAATPAALGISCDGGSP